MRPVLIFILSCIQLTIFAQCTTAWIYKTTDPVDVPVQTIFPAASTGWVSDPAFTDEFDGPLNTSKWNTLPQGPCHWMSKAAYFKPENAFTENGKLILRTVYEPTVYYCGDSAMHYSTGWIGTFNRAQYGYFEIKCTMPENSFQQPCFWMFGQQNMRYDEIDVNEFHVEPPYYLNRTRQNIYHMECSENCLDTLKSAQLIEANYNQPLVLPDMVFAVEWFPYEIHYYVNGKVMGSAKYTTDMRLLSPYGFQPTSEFSCIGFDNAIPQWIQLSLSLMGNTAELLPYSVDYIRAYKLQVGSALYWPQNISLQDENLSKVHTDVLIGGDGTHSGEFPTQCQINLWANNSITFQKGTIISNPVLFTARTVGTTPTCFVSGNQQNEE